MALYLVKLLVSAALIVAVTEVAKVNTTLGGLIKSLPLVSLIAMIWLYAETRDTARIAALSISTFWFVLPTLPLFVVLPVLLKRGWAFFPSLALSVAVMLVCYIVTMQLLRRYGVVI